MSQLKSFRTGSQTFLMEEEVKEQNSWFRRIKLIWKSEFIAHVQQMFALATPIFFTLFFQTSLNMVSIAFAGQKGRIELDGVSLAMSVIHIFGTSVGLGISNACDTLFAQSFGSNDKKKTGLFLQRSILIVLLCPFPVAALLLNIEHLLLFLGQDPEISHVTASFIAAYIPALPFQYIYYVLCRYMQNQDKVWPPLVSVLCGNIINACTQYLFVKHLDYGYQASAGCVVITYMFMVVFCSSYIFISRFYEPTWAGWNLGCLYDWMEFLKLGLPGIGHASFEQINWEAELFMAGIMGEVPMAVHSILAQTGTTTCGTYYALAIGSNVRIGQYFGANEPDKAKKIVHVSLFVITIISSIICILVMSLSRIWPMVFTSDIYVIHETAKLLPFYPIYYFPESFVGVMVGVLRGCGKQATAMYVAFGCMYLIGLPLAAILGFLTPLKIPGMWIGNIIGLTTLTIAFYTLIRNLDWEDLANKARMRLEASTYLVQSQSSEHKPLLTSTQIMANGLVDSQISQYQLAHTRIPSHVISCSTDLFYTKPTVTLAKKLQRNRLKHKLSKNKKRIIIKRIFCLVACVAIFFIGLIFHFALPPAIPKHHSVGNMTTLRVPTTTHRYNVTL